MTQMYNPALTASMYDFESSVSYRSHKVSNSKKLNSYGAAFGTTLFPNRRKNQGNLTMGMNMYHQSLNSQFSSTSVLGSASYHVFFAKASKFSVGLNYGLFSMGMNVEDGQWASQHDGSMYNSMLLSGENLERNQINKFDCGAGIQFSQTSKKIVVPLFQFGVALFHVNQPKLNFLNGSSNQLPIRTIVNSSFAIPLGKYGSFLQTSFAYQQQSKFKSTSVGIIANIKLSEAAKTTSSYGKINVWYAGIGFGIRSKDAFIINASVQKSNWKLVLAYDFNTSSYRNSATSKNAVEIILLYNIHSFKLSSRY